MSAVRNVKAVTYLVSALAIVGLFALAAPAIVPLFTTPPASETVEPEDELYVTVDEVSTVTELPEWAARGRWVIYPEGFECAGTEGCPNDFRALLGEPGDTLPPGVRYYDPQIDFRVVPEPDGVRWANQEEARRYAVELEEERKAARNPAQG